MIAATHDHTHLLFEEYLKERNVKLSKEEFSYLVLLFPSLLVCMSDGKLDQKEWEGIKLLAENLADEFSDIGLGIRDQEALSSALLIEFRYLLDNTDRWSKKFLNALQQKLSIHPEEKEFILETMYLFANTDEGISDVEQAAIDTLHKRLALSH